MIVITTPLGSVGLLSIAYSVLLFGRFSRRLAAVTRMPDRYSWYLVASSLVAVATASQLMRAIAALAADAAPSVMLQLWFVLLTFHIPLAVGVTLALILVWWDWQWILRERAE